MKKGKGLKLSDPGVLIGISILLLLIGGMITDPLAGFFLLALAAVLALVAAIRAPKRLRLVAIALLIVLIAMAAEKFPQAGRHLELYKSRQGGGAAPGTPAGGA